MLDRGIFSLFFFLKSLFLYQKLAYYWISYYICRRFGGEIPDSNA